MASGQKNFYSNPAFCQQSEFYNKHQKCTNPRSRALSPERRHPPIGAHKPVSAEIYNTPEIPPKIGPKPRQRIKSLQADNYEDVNEIYDEMLVDDGVRLKNTAKIGEIDNQRYLDISNGNIHENNYSCNDNEEIDENIQDAGGYIVNRTNGRYAAIPVEENEEQRQPKHRYEYIQMQEQPNGYPSSPRKSPVKQELDEEVEIVQGRIHRYSVIPPQEEIEKPLKQGRYALVPINEIQQNSRYAVIPREEIITHGYEYISDERCYQEMHHTMPKKQTNQVYNQKVTVTSPIVARKGNPIATQKLHELLATPKKVQRSASVTTPRKILSPETQRRNMSPQARDPFFTPTKTVPKVVKRQTPRVQQKLNYVLSTRQQNPQESKRHTAIITPICSSPVQSVYSETTFSNKTESWMNLSMRNPPIQATLAVAAVMMILCGGLTSALCFYMVSIVGRMYYLDFGIVSGFACLLLGLLGFRSRNCHWLPNRNYISGYIVLSAFSLLTCAGLLVLLFLQPKPGSPLADVTSGAVCGISGLSLILASAGVIASYCCKYPPPDNRVQHCAPGFTV